MNYTVFDIETIPLPADKLPPFDESSVAMGNIKDEAKRAAKIEEARAEYLASAALHWTTGQVAAVGFLYRGQVAINGGREDASEIEIVSWSLLSIAHVLNCSEDVAGFNIFHFDLPFLIHRAHALGVSVPKNLRTRSRGRSYWHENLIDLREEWLLGDHAPPKGTSSLGAIARFLGLPEKLGSGADFATLTPEQRRDYLARDLEITEALYRRLF